MSGKVIVSLLVLALAYILYPSVVLPGGLLIGSGATFPQPQLEAWISAFNSLDEGFEVEYTAKGSGGGQNDLMAGVVDFACSDPPLSHEMWMRLRGRGVIQFPFLLGAVVVVYNLPGIKELRLSGEVIASMYMGDLRYWDDERILDLNPDLRGRLPHERIILVHRADSSGTTFIFTYFLSVSSREWRERVGYGKTVTWPVDSTGYGLGGPGNLGVAQAVISNPYSLGYVEWSFALKMSMKYALIRNARGEFLHPSPEALTHAAERALAALPNDFREDLSGDLETLIESAYNSSYPLIAWSHMVFLGDRLDGRGLAWLTWIAEHGEEYMVEGYAPMPRGFWTTLLSSLGGEA